MDFIDIIVVIGMIIALFALFALLTLKKVVGGVLRLIFRPWRRTTVVLHSPRTRR